MYNKSLDAFRMVAEEMSFSKAAEKLYITHTAVIKQINGLESHLGVKLFIRSNHGVTLSPAGQVLYTEALQIMKFSDEAIQRVQQAHFASPQTLKIGTSVLYPCHFFMDLWDELRSQYPQFQLKIISFQDDKNRLSYIGDHFDFVIGAYNAELDNSSYDFLPVGEYRFCLAVPRAHSLSGHKSLSFQDLSGHPLMIMRQGTSPINDTIRKDIQKKYKGINLVDIDPHYDVSTFNQCVERNSVLLSLECWDRVHPDIKTIPLKEDYRIPYGIVYSCSKDTNSPTVDFIKMLKTTIDKRSKE